MKKYTFFIILIISLNACGTNKKQTIVGKWQLSFNLDNHIKSLEPIEREAVQAMKVSELETMVKDRQKELNNTQYIFDEKGKYEIYQNDEKKQEGSWLMNTKQDTLYINAPDKSKYAYFIQECTPSSLSLKEKNGKVPLYFTPSK